MSATNRFHLTGIESIRFAVADPDLAIRFALDWGLTRVDDAVDGVADDVVDGAASRTAHSAARFRAVDGSGVDIVAADARDPARSVRDNGDGKSEDSGGVNEITWGVADPAGLGGLARELGRDRDVHFDAAGVLHTVDDLGLGIAFRMARRHPVPVEPTRFNAPGNANRIDRRAERYTRARPHEISHIAIGVDDAGEAAKFYLERLGFIVSDRYANRGLFMRCAPTGNHHHLFLMNGQAPGTRFNHLAFKVRDVHEVIGGGQALDAKGWKTFAGPGRHIVSSACFWYFQTPFGSLWEYAADEDIVTETWETTDFAATAHIFSEWTFGLEKSDGRLRGPIALSREIAGETLPAR